MLSYMQARALHPTLNPVFRYSAPMHFENVSLRSQIQVKLYDAKNLGRSLLGKAALPAAAIPGSDPVYLWLALAPPEEWRLLGLVSYHKIRVAHSMKSESKSQIEHSVHTRFDF